MKALWDWNFRGANEGTLAIRGGLTTRGWAAQISVLSAVCASIFTAVLYDKGANDFKNPAGDEYQALYLGLNYFLAGHGHKLMLGVEVS